MTRAILELLEQNEHLDDAALDAFVERRGSPIVEGPSVTFIYRGEADAVYLQHFIFGLESSNKMTRVRGTDLWHVVIDVPQNSRFEYKLLLERGGRKRLIRDPLNPHLARDPFGANSVCHGSGYVVPDWSHKDPAAREGRIEEHRVPSEALGGDRVVHVYTPARLSPNRSYRLVVAFDGPDYARFASLTEVLDNLIHRDEIPPVIVAMCKPHDRMREYAACPDHARFVAEELLPYMESNFPLRPEPRARCLMGASLGGVASLYTAWKYPRTFGRLLLQSGSFAFTDIGEHDGHPVLQPVVEFINEFRREPHRLAGRVYVSCGVYESLIWQNRALAPILQSTTMDVRYEEVRDGHNWEGWRDRLRGALSWLFPGPIGLVYE